MQSKLCLVLALVVLVGALAVGNPFLDHGSPVVSDPVVSDPAVSDGAAQPFSEAGSGIALGFGRGVLEGGAAASSQLASSQQFSLRAAAPSSAALTSVCCPDEQLRGLVVRVHHDHAGMPVWELRDGRFVRANPHHGDGQPLVVSVDAGVVDSDHSFESGK